MTRLPHLAGNFGVGETLADNAGNGKVKPIRIVDLAVIESKHLLVNVAKQMERLNRNISPFEAALQETPKVFNAVRVNLTINVLLRMVNHLMDVIIALRAKTPTSNKEAS